MKERPILLTEENRQAVRENRKRQTRRVIVPQPPADAEECGPNSYDGPEGPSWFWFKDVSPEASKALFRHPEDPFPAGVVPIKTWPPAGMHCRYGRTGDRLWMQEPYRVIEGHNRVIKVEYLDDGAIEERTLTAAEWKRWAARKRPFGKTTARFMYKSLTRTWLENTDVRVQRVQEISEEDAYWEGCDTEFCARCDESGEEDGEPCPDCAGEGRFSCCDQFRKLWDSVNKARGHGWEKNDWVWAITFRRVEAQA